jgi:catechol 2,3-dioxygenase-like lactoylglutathione lyase family enzyme
MLTKERGVTVMRLAGICLISKDVSRLVNFYKDVLRIEAEEESAEFAGFLMNGVKLLICSHEIMESMAENSMQNAGFGSFTLEVEVENVDAEYERLKRKQVPFVKPPTTQAWGIRSVWFRDPDGNIINFQARV